MTNKSLFEACVTQCEWCNAQWPLVNGSHVAPFTRDPNLFSWRCSALAIRKGFDYWDYEGGKEKKWKVPSPEELLKVMGGFNHNAKIGRNISSPENRGFWRTGIRCSIEVRSWPEWKRGGSKQLTPAQVAQEDADDREELLLFDAADYWTRQSCTENHQFQAGRLNKQGCFERPTCNYGLGCTTCWVKYEKHSEEWNRQHNTIY